ncbi:MAG TPA: Mur ligase family protein, partial [Polyangiaceae bacterium]|nr:Mur ligase family protein [Polyangiaceae bacterium]
MASKPLSKLPPATRAGLSLGELVAELAPFGPVLHGDPALRVSDVVQDSRRVLPGVLFVARPGSKTDGLRHVPEAAQRGAAGVLLSQSAAPVGPLGLPWISVRNLPRALAVAAEAVQGNPSRELRLVGVTGTNGKTTVTWLVQRALERLGALCGRLGTLGFEVAGQQFETDLTTPEADTLSRGLAWMRTLGAGVAAMEVSSIALTSARADALRFEVAAFTNLTQDHLDFHGSFDAYRQAKARLFLELSPAVSVLNLDDEFGGWLREHTT